MCGRACQQLSFEGQLRLRATPYRFHWQRLWRRVCDCEMPGRYRQRCLLPLVRDIASRHRFYLWLERTWMLQQIPLGMILFVAGGWSLVGMGIGLRVFVSLTGHWVVGHFAHKRGKQRWVIDTLPVQGYNLPYLSWIGYERFGRRYRGLQ